MNVSACRLYLTAARRPEFVNRAKIRLVQRPTGGAAGFLDLRRTPHADDRARYLRTAQYPRNRQLGDGLTVLGGNRA